MMELSIRPYNPEGDFDVIKSWISDERTHAMWCANRTAFPIQKDAFQYQDESWERCNMILIRNHENH